MAGEERAQRIEHGPDDVVMDGRQPGHDRHASEFLGNFLAKAYAGYRCDLHVHFRASLVEGGKAGDWCAAFNRTPKELNIVGGQVVGDKEARSRLREKHDIRQTVLVLDVKPVKLPKVVVAELVPFLVRLQFLDDCLRTFVDAPEHAVEFARILLLKDRESGIAFDALGHLSSFVNDSEFEGEVVEGGSKVVNTVSDDETKVGRRLVKHFEPRQLVATINIEVRPGSVRAFLAPSPDFGLEALQMIERPLQPPFVVEGHGLRDKYEDVMADERDKRLVPEDEPSQITEKGLEMTEPERGEVFDDLDKTSTKLTS